MFLPGDNEPGRSKGGEATGGQGGPAVAVVLAAPLAQVDRAAAGRVVRQGLEPQVRKATQVNQMPAVSLEKNSLKSHSRLRILRISD